MKRYMKREVFNGALGFTVYEETGQVLYRVKQEDEQRRQKLLIFDEKDRLLSEVMRKQFMMQYFTIRCQTGIYVLIPNIKEYFMFLIYGSTYRFAGNMAEGRFSLFDVDKSPVMTQKKCWTTYGDGYELELYVPEQEIFSLSVAVCAALYRSAAETAADGC